MSAPWIATMLDQEQIEGAGTAIESRLVDVEGMPPRSGHDVASELGGRLLIRYLTNAQVGDFDGGDTSRGHWTTPTPVGRDDVAHWLSLFAPNVERDHVLLLDPAAVPTICGPAWIRFGEGIEYYLPGGFPKTAVLDVGSIGLR